MAMDFLKKNSRRRLFEVGQLELIPLLKAIRIKYRLVLSLPFIYVFITPGFWPFVFFCLSEIRATLVGLQVFFLLFMESTTTS